MKNQVNIIDKISRSYETMFGDYGSAMNKHSDRYVLFFLIGIPSIVTIGRAQDFFGRSKELYAKAMEMKKVGNYTEAAKNLSKIIDKYLKLEVIQEACYQHGAVLFRKYEWQYWQTKGLHKYFQALNSFRQVNTAVDTLAAKSLHMQARCFRRIDSRLAMALYDSVAQRYPDDHLADDALFMSAYIVIPIRRIPSPSMNACAAGNTSRPLVFPWPSLITL